PLSKVPEKESYPVVAYVGRLKKAKRPDHAIKAFRIVKEEFPEAELWIIGNGYFRKDLENMATNGLRFFSGVSDEERRGWVSRAWVLVNPSVREGFGLNVVEANALGTPCVVYDVPGLRDSVKNYRTGLLAEGGNVLDLSNKLILVLKDDTLRERLSSNALEFSKNFDWDTSAREFEGVLRALCDRQ
ncbi:MAG: glycosyltransferase family 4 protein, partial [Candidatus Hodarchaeota archaeon]